MHLKLRGAYMFHMFGWALCLSMGVFQAMSAALSGDATHSGNGPVGACCDRRDLFHLIHERAEVERAACWGSGSRHGDDSGSRRLCEVAAAVQLL